MFVHYRTQGLILKKEGRGEADQLFTIYTKNFGKLEILGKAIRKVSSKLRSGAEIFYLSEIEFIQGKAHKTLTDAVLIEKFENIRKDLRKLRVAYKISEVLDNLVKDQEPDENLWRLLSETFQKLNNYPLPVTGYPLPITGYQLLLHYFFWNLLSILGYQPEIYHCVLCQKKLLPGKLFFDLKEGGVICQNCFKENQSVEETNPETIKILRIILKRDWQTLLKLKIEPGYLNSLKIISKNYLLFVFGESGYNKKEARI